MPPFDLSIRPYAFSKSIQSHHDVYMSQWRSCAESLWVLKFTQFAVYPVCGLPSLRFTQFAVYPVCGLPSLRFTQFAVYPVPRFTTWTHICLWLFDLTNYSSLFIALFNHTRLWNKQASTHGGALNWTALYWFRGPVTCRMLYTYRDHSVTVMVELPY